MVPVPTPTRTHDTQHRQRLTHDGKPFDSRDEGEAEETHLDRRLVWDGDHGLGDVVAGGGGDGAGLAHGCAGMHFRLMRTANVFRQYPCTLAAPQRYRQ